MSAHPFPEVKSSPEVKPTIDERWASLMEIMDNFSKQFEERDVLLRALCEKIAELQKENQDLREKLLKKEP